VIPFQHETIVPLLHIREHIPSARRGKRLSKGVIFRWAKKGVAGVVLETFKVGGSRFTSLEALQRFIDGQNCTAGSTCASGHRDRRAAAELKLRGI
jgi:hypothetical protein